MLNQYISDHFHNEIDLGDMQLQHILPHLYHFYSLSIHHIFFLLAHMDQLYVHQNLLSRNLLLEHHNGYRLIDIFDTLLKEKKIILVNRAHILYKMIYKYLYYTNYVCLFVFIGDKLILS